MVRADLPGICDVIPGGSAAGLGCRVVDKGSDAAVGGIKDAAMAQVQNAIKGLVAEIAKATADFVDRTAELVNKVTAPPIGADWFTSVYESLFYPASLVIAVLFLVGTAWATIRRNGADLGQVIYGTAGAIGAAAAFPFIVKGLLAIVDVASAHVAASVHTDVEAFMTRIGKLLSSTAAGAPGMSAFALALPLALFLLGAFGVVVEMLLRSVAITVLLAISPVIFAGLVMRGGAQLVRKAVYVMLALIFSKLAIVTILVLGMAGLARAGKGGDSLTGLLTVSVLMLLAAFALPAVLRVVGDMDGGAHIPSRGEAGKATGASKMASSSKQVIGAQMSKAGQSAGTAKAGAAAGGAATGGATAALAAAQQTAQAAKNKANGSPSMNGGPAGPATGAWTAPRHAKPGSGK